MSSILRSYARGVAHNHMKKAGLSRVNKSLGRNTTTNEKLNSYFARNWREWITKTRV